MKTSKGGYWIEFESKEEEKEFNEEVVTFSSKLVAAIGSIMLIQAEHNIKNNDKE